MKYYRYYLRANRGLILCVLWICLSIDLIIFGADIPNVDVDGYWLPIFICLGVTVFIMAALLLWILLAAKKNRKVLEILDKQGPCEELVQAYKQAHPKLNAAGHVTLASYYLAMDRFQEAEYELSTAGSYVMADVPTKAFYSEVFIEMRLRQRRFDEAIIMYNNYNSVLETYCRSNKNGICVDHYSHGALLYAYSGNPSAAMLCIRKMEKTIRKKRELAFTRNTALMGVYLIMGDFANADNIKNMMLKDLEEFDEFTFDSARELLRKEIGDMTELLDPRVQRQ